jgi:hypothetical protein
VDGLHRRSVHPSVDDATLPEGGLIRAGSFAMLIFASSSLIMAMVLPWLVETSTTKMLAEPSRTRKSSHDYVHRSCSLRRTWTVCQIILCACMMLTFFVDSVVTAYFLVALVGLPWAAGTWIPITLISTDIRRAQDEMLRNAEIGCLAEEDLAATIIGLHNFAISAPQVVAGLCGSLLFSLAASHKAGEDVDGLEVWLLRFGGLAALAAAWLTNELPEEEREGLA